MCEGKPAKTRIWKSDLAVCLDQVGYTDVRVAIAGIPVRFLRLRRGRNDGDGLLRAVLDAGEAVFAIPFSDGAAVDQLVKTSEYSQEYFYKRGQVLYALFSSRTIWRHHKPWQMQICFHSVDFY